MDSTITAPLTEEVDGFMARLHGTLPDVASGRKCVARAPGRLDVMGGFAEYTGSLMLSYPVHRSVLVAVSPRSDQTVSVLTLHHEGNGTTSRCSWPLAGFYAGQDRLATASAVASMVRDEDSPCVRSAAAGLYALLESQTAANLGGGLTIAIRSKLHGLRGLGSDGASTAAVLIAVTRALEVDVEPMQFADLAQRGLNALWGRAQDIADPAAAALAQEGCLLQLRTRDRKVLGRLALPDGVALTGVECGAMAKGSDEKYLDARTAAFMGRNLIGRILEADGRRSPEWEGYLSQLTISDYVERLRDRIPTRISGADFLDRFGAAGDPLTTIDPAKTYKVRSRTEHHIYENSRAWQFAEKMARLGRTNDRHAAIEAGELMYASHWSYGQRCGLGSIATDKLTNLLRKRGADAGIFGAKISGRGAGGTVVVLHSNDGRARSAIAEAADEYGQVTDHTATIVDGSSPGALTWGVQELSD